MAINLDEGNLKDGLLGLVVALVEIIQELLERQALRRIEGGSLSDAEIERLGESLCELSEALEKIKADNDIEDAVRSVRDGLDQVADDLLDKFLNPETCWKIRQRSLRNMPEEARYIYCIIHSAAGIEQKEDLGEIGIEKQAVYTIPYKDIAAVVHSCQPRPYDTKDRKLAEEWILEHSYVIDHAMKKFGSVLPFSFDVILKGTTLQSMWLGKNYKTLRENWKL